MKKWIALILIAALVLSFATGMAAGKKKKKTEKNETKQIALTFDDGPSDYTLKVVEILDKYNVKATFFMVGNNMCGPNGQERTKAVFAAGHEIGLHSWKHSKLTSFSYSDIVKDLTWNQNWMEKDTGTKATLFRPPYGSNNNNVISAARKLGLAIIKWSLDSRDWESRNVNTIVNLVTSTVQPGDIILMHDRISVTWEAVDRIIPALQEKGYTFVTVTELLTEARGTPPQAGVTYFKAQEDAGES